MRVPICAVLVAFAATAAGAQSPAPADPAVAVVQAQVDAFNRGDVTAFVAAYADDIELFDLGSEPKPSLTGRAALTARYDPMFRQMHPQAAILSRIVNGAFVIDKERITAGGRSMEGVAIYQVEAGKIRRVWFTP